MISVFWFFLILISVIIIIYNLINFVLKRTINLYEKYGPTAVVLGGSVGLGKEFSKSLARRGFNLILVARNFERLERVSKEIEKEFKVSVLPIGADISSEPEKVMEFCKGKDIGLVIFNAAFGLIGKFEHFSFDEMNKVIDLNVKGVTQMSRYFGEKFLAERENKKSGLILVSSLTGVIGSSVVCCYGASKSFITSLAEGLWSEWRGRGIDVRSPVLPAVNTPSFTESNVEVEKVPGVLNPDECAEKCLLTLCGFGARHLIGWPSQILAFFIERVLPRSLAGLMLHQNMKSIYGKVLQNQ